MRFRQPPRHFQKGRPTPLRFPAGSVQYQDNLVTLDGKHYQQIEGKFWAEIDKGTFRELNRQVNPPTFKEESEESEQEESEREDLFEMATNNTKEVKLRQPADFNGNHKQTCAFLLDVDSYIKANPDVYDTNLKKILFALSYFRGGAAEI